MANILELIKLAEKSSKEYEPGEKYGVPGDTPRIGAFGTMYDQALPWSERIPRTYSTGSDEFKEKKGKERKVEYIDRFIKQILREGDRPKNAHENIDNEIIANTLQEIAHTQRGEGMDLLYKALTKKGKETFIHAYEPTSGDIDARKEIRDWKGNMLRREIEQNPSFADTISYEKGMEQLAPRESITSKILKALGI